MGKTGTLTLLKKITTAKKQTAAASPKTNKIKPQKHQKQKSEAAA